MPSSEKYQQIVKDKRKCPKCGRDLGDKNFATCLRCRTMKGRAREIRPAMSLFSGQKSESKMSNTPNWAKEILDSIAATGTVTAKVNPIIGGKDSNLSAVLNLSSGAARLQTNVVRKFTLIMSQPFELSTFDAKDIRCCLCNRSIRPYPVWYYNIKYAVNHFHYFICFDPASPTKPTTKCYKRS